jgi:hypothetical protein
MKNMRKIEEEKVYKTQHKRPQHKRVQISKFIGFLAGIYGKEEKL